MRPATRSVHGSPRIEAEAFTTEPIEHARPLVRGERIRLGGFRLWPLEPDERVLNGKAVRQRIAHHRAETARNDVLDVFDRQPARKKIGLQTTDVRRLQLSQQPLTDQAYNVPPDVPPIVAELRLPNERRD